jgi:hypothetical protein
MFVTYVSLHDLVISLPLVEGDDDDEDGSTATLDT